MTPAHSALRCQAWRVAMNGGLPFLHRVFAYPPLEHAENLRLQDTSVASFEALFVEVSPVEQLRFSEFLDYARGHREVIARFGRFSSPQRGAWPPQHGR
jgi:uncharacterized protein (DUF924 family)